MLRRGARSYMTDESRKLARFKKAVSDETEAQVQQMTEDAEKESRELIEQAKAAEEQRSKAKLRELETLAEQRLSREVSAAKLDSHRSVLIRREELADGVFEDVRRRLAEFRAGEQYGEWLSSTVTACMSKYRGKAAAAYLAPDDLRYENDLKALGVNVREDRSIVLGGVSVRFEEQGIVLDCTFDSMLERERADFCNNPELAADRNQA